MVNEEADEVVVDWLEFFRSTNLAEGARVGELAEARELWSVFAASCRTAKRNYRGRSHDRS